MPRFFVGPVAGETAVVTGQDARHIRGALRMRPGETLTLCDGQGTDYFCEIAGFEGEDVCLRVLYRTPTACEPSLSVTLYQGLPKGDKLELILQKAVELGAAAVIPFVAARSVARPEEGERAEKKRRRWQRIADEAAGQCGRGILPAVEGPLPWTQALARLREEDGPTIVFYEGGGRPLRELVSPGLKRLSIVVGPEGGFERAEIDALEQLGAKVATLGPRILRCETAPLAALAVTMAYSGNLE